MFLNIAGLYQQNSGKKMMTYTVMTIPCRLIFERKLIVQCPLSAVTKIQCFRSRLGRSVNFCERFVCWVFGRTQDQTAGSSVKESVTCERLKRIWRSSSCQKKKEWMFRATMTFSSRYPYQDLYQYLYQYQDVQGEYQVLFEVSVPWYQDVQ